MDTTQTVDEQSVKSVTCKICGKTGNRSNSRVVRKYTVYACDDPFCCESLDDYADNTP